jgi:hypothetical protein
MKLAFCFYAAAAVPALVVGVLYMFRREFMPYHATAAGAAWSDLAPGLRVLLLALIRGVGGGFLALGISLTVLLVGPFRAGDVWAEWALPLIGFAAALPTLWGVHLIRTRTAARPPWTLAVVSVVALSAGVIATVVAHVTS